MDSTHCTLANLFGKGYYGTTATSIHLKYKGLYWSTFRKLLKSWQKFLLSFFDSI